MISETIEFCLWHERDIQLALENETGSVLHAVIHVSGLSGYGSGVKSSKVSDPTYMNALRRIEAVNCLSVPYGPLYGHSPKYNAETKLFAADRRWRENFTLHFPVKWLLVTASVKRYFLDEDNRLHDFFNRRYILLERWEKSCEELKIKKSRYFIMRAEVIRAGELYAAGYGAATVESMLR